MTRFVSALEVVAMLADRLEIAFLDVREIVPFGAGHPLLAANLPLSYLELSIAKLVPRSTTRIILTDGGDVQAALAAERLERLGYSEVAVLEGGAPAWVAAGLTLFPEIEVLTKGFGAFAKRFGHPTFISPPELDRALRSDEDYIVLDSRPPAEYRKGNIPGSIDAPGADMVRCFDDLVPSASTKVVVNCMSATRGILGGLSLKAAGVPNDVYVLHHGTRGWLLEGLELETNASRFPAPVSAVAVDRASARAARIANRAGLLRIDMATLEGWRGDKARTTYVFDVRSPDEYVAGHLGGARNAPHGSIVMSPDHYFATLQARIVLVDDDTVRATITALWLAQMGWGEVAVLGDGLDGRSLVSGPEARHDIGFEVAARRELTAHQVDALRRAQAVRIIDVGRSDCYLDRHLPGAVWCSRVALGRLLREEPYDGPTLLTSEHGVLARLAAHDLDTSLASDVLILAGGNVAWREAGLEVSSGAERLASPRDDHWLASSERPGDRRQNVIDYLEWEEILLDDIEGAGTVPYRNLIWS
ncbi:MAG: rhodanese-like domain-containing protein [bacterium]|nr:rhodanese-like domain-containing protein [bacterium]